MIERGGGSIINITSGAAGFTRPGVGAHEGFMAYGVSKAALERLTLYFSAEFEQDNIAVNAISPGFVGRPGAAEGGYMAQGEEPDLEFWGDPLVHLAQQRPQDGFTGKIVHTYQFGRSWGPKPEQPPQWNEHIRAILRDAGINE
jgi:NAD(P)-dependent dehydrogenase (short-subunit alcohol dehydrogenase family)